jgi:pseudouridine-5'-phosphate glycosidase
MLSKKIKVNTKVQEALENNKSIVALESTLISHGLPYPENINVAKESIKAAYQHHVTRYHHSRMH